MRKIGIVGVGFVGGAVSRYFKGDARFTVVEHDPPRGLVGDLSGVDVVFVCVPTPFGPRGFDDSYVRAAVANVPGSKIVAVKSTVVPGTTDRLQAEFPQHNILFNPEFLRERCAYEDFVRPDRQIVGCGADQIEKAKDLVEILPAAPFATVTTRIEAELAKYFSNCYLSMRVTFANQIYDLCDKLGISYEGVRRLAEADPRVGPGYLDVATDGYRGYGGTCFPKDMRALIEIGRALGAPQRVLEACEEVNCDLLRAGGRTQWLPPGEGGNDA
jgi:UDPglucose 6-dehydrogenase